jgi:hypothetical protein
VIPNYPPNPLSGALWFNGQDIQVYNGTAWQNVTATPPATITMNQVATDAITWAQKKMYEESHIKELAAKNVTIADALAKYELAAEQLKVVLTLTK